MSTRSKKNQKGPFYEVLSPVGQRAGDVQHAAAHFSDLNGKTICELDSRGFRANETLPVIREMLTKRYPGVKIVPSGEIYSPDHEDQAVKIREKSLDDLRSALLQKGCDAVVSGNGG